MFNICFVYMVRSRLSANAAAKHMWIRKNFTQRNCTSPVRPVVVTRLVDFVDRRRHQVGVDLLTALLLRAATVLNCFLRNFIFI